MAFAIFTNTKSVFLLASVHLLPSGSWKIVWWKETKKASCKSSCWQILLSKKGLLTGEFHLIVTDFPIDEKGIVTAAFFKEQLFLSIHPSHPLAAKEEIELTDLADLTMLIRSDLGIWQSLVETLTQTKFIVQKDWETFEELIQASNLPCFSTNISQDFSENNQGRAHIPIRDPEATKTFYLYIIQLERDKSWSEEHPYISTIKQPSIADFAKNGCFFLIFSLRMRVKKITVLRIAMLTRKIIVV